MTQLILKFPWKSSGGSQSHMPAEWKMQNLLLRWGTWVSGRLREKWRGKSEWQWGRWGRGSISEVFLPLGPKNPTDDKLNMLLFLDKTLSFLLRLPVLSPLFSNSWPTRGAILARLNFGRKRFSSGFTYSMQGIGVDNWKWADGPGVLWRQEG